MELSAKFVRAQLQFFQPLMEVMSLESIRKSQDKLGELMKSVHRQEILCKDHPFEHFNGAWFIP